MPFHLRSQVFKEGGPIPSKYTGEGEDISPPLQWEGAPEKNKSFALIVDDPDAPSKRNFFISTNNRGPLLA